MKPRVLFPLVTAAACLAAAGTAGAATTEAVSANWAGYEAAPNNGSNFSAVSGGWTEPKVDCSQGSPDYSAYWVGLGGGGEESSALEQVGTQADCNTDGSATYYAWYELVPSAPVSLKLTIKPGDKIYARTAVSGTSVTVYLNDSTSGKSVSKTLHMSNPDTSTAEWIAEAPSECEGNATSSCTPLPLADFGKVRFSNAHATAGGHTGAISDSHWQAQPIALEPDSGGFTGAGWGGWRGYGGGSSSYGLAASTASADSGATPSSLSGGGQSFSVSYGGAGSTSTASGTESGNTSPGDGYGYSGGYDGYGGGYGDGSSGYGGGYGYGDVDGYGFGGGYGYGAGSGYGYGDSGYGDAYGYSPYDYGSASYGDEGYGSYGSESYGYWGY